MTDDTDDVVRTGGMEIAALRKVLFGVTGANPDDGDTIVDAATDFVDTVEEMERRLDAVEAFDATEPVAANHDVRADGGGDGGG
jgi:hypothetical protein